MIFLTILQRYKKSKHNAKAERHNKVCEDSIMSAQQQKQQQQQQQQLQEEEETARAMDGIQWDDDSVSSLSLSVVIVSCRGGFVVGG